MTRMCQITDIQQMHSHFEDTSRQNSVWTKIWTCAD